MIMRTANLPLGTAGLRESLDDASETKITFRDILAYYLAAEKERMAEKEGREVDSRLDVVPGPEIDNLFLYPDRLPSETRDFIILQLELSNGDTDYILGMSAPPLLKHKYAIKSARLRDITSAKTRREALERFLSEVERNFKKLFESYAYFESLWNSIEQVDGEISRTLAVIAPQDRGFFQKTVDEFDKIKLDTQKIKNVLEERRIPDINTLETVESQIKTQTTKVKNVKLNLAQRYLQYRKQKAQTAEDVYDYAETNMMNRASLFASGLVSKIRGKDESDEEIDDDRSTGIDIGGPSGGNSGPAGESWGSGGTDDDGPTGENSGDGGKKGAPPKPETGEEKPEPKSE